MGSLLLTELAGISPWGLVTLCVVGILLGWLVPRASHNQRIQDKQEQIDYLRELLDKREKQLQQALEHNELSVKALEDLRREATRREAA